MQNDTSTNIKTIGLQNKAPVTQILELEPNNSRSILKRILQRRIYNNSSAQLDLSGGDFLKEGNFAVNSLFL